MGEEVLAGNWTSILEHNIKNLWIFNEYLANSVSWCIGKQENFDKQANSRQKRQNYFDYYSICQWILSIIYSDAYFSNFYVKIINIKLI